MTISIFIALIFEVQNKIHNLQLVINKSTIPHWQLSSTCIRKALNKDALVLSMRIVTNMIQTGGLMSPQSNGNDMRLCTHLVEYKEGDFSKAFLTEVFELE